MVDKEKIPRRVKKTETIREKANKPVKEKPRRIIKAADKATQPVKKAGRAGRKEFHLPIPDNKLGRFLKRRVRIIPPYFIESWNELKQVTRPTRRETIRLTIAVLLFAVFFGGVIYVVDLGLEKYLERY